MEKRLIDANSLKAEIRDFYESEYPTASGEFDKFATMHLPRIINNSPTIEKWISVEEKLPECETEVFVLAVSSYGNKTVTTAIYEDGKMPEDESDWTWEDVEMDYNEETDQWIIPCGWWEYRHYGECLNFAVDDKVTHWMPLPELPKEGANNG